VDFVENDLIRIADGVETSQERQDCDDGQGELVIPFRKDTTLGVVGDLVQELRVLVGLAIWIRGGWTLLVLPLSDFGHGRNEACPKDSRMIEAEVAMASWRREKALLQPNQAGGRRGDEGKN
jgi:hypothetical protein